MMQSSHSTSWPRKILHVDMDAFYAAVEQRDRPELRGKPVVVGGNPFGRGVVSTASYEARKYGIHSAMPAAEAKRLCPNAIFLRPDFERYTAVSRSIRSILSKYTDLIEPVSLDEAYLDITRNKLLMDDPVLLARMIQQNIRAATQLTASVGVAPNKFIAKIASDMKKPAGLTVVPPEKVTEFLDPLLVRKIPGIGPVTEKQLHAIGIRTVGELKKISQDVLIARFGKWGKALYDRARGADESPVENEGEPKQLGAEETFERDLTDRAMLEAKIAELAGEVAERIVAKRIRAKTVTLKVKYADFTVITRSRTRAESFVSKEAVTEDAIMLLREKTEATRRPIRLLGVSVSNLIWPDEEKTTSMQGELFES